MNCKLMFPRFNIHFVKAFCKEEKIITGKKNFVHSMPHPLWTENDYKNVKIDHREPHSLGDRFAHLLI